MKTPVRWNRWHRYSADGLKHIKRFPVNSIPDPLINDGYTEWKQGTGPWSEEHYKNVTDAVRRVCLGVPKTEAHKQKMRQAKIGKPKTEAHKHSMRLAWARRRELGTHTKSIASKLKTSETMKQPRIDMYVIAMEKLKQLQNKA